MKRMVMAGGAVLAILPAPALADSYRVPQDYPTIQAAVDAAMTGPKHNTSGNAVIHVANGTWAGVALSGTVPQSGGSMGRGYLEIVGSGPGTVIAGGALPGFRGTLIATNGAALMISDLTVETDRGTADQSALFAQNNAIIQVGGGVTFGPATKQHMHAEANAVIEVGRSYTVTGGAYNHWAASTGGLIEIDPEDLTITFAKPVRFEHFAWAQSGGTILFGQDANGAKARFVHPERASAAFGYVVRSNGVIDLNGGRQPLPGVKGEVESGGQYVGGPGAPPPDAR